MSCFVLGKEFPSSWCGNSGLGDFCFILLVCVFHRFLPGDSKYEIFEDVKLFCVLLCGEIGTSVSDKFLLANARNAKFTNKILKIK